MVSVSCSRSSDSEFRIVINRQAKEWKSESIHPAVGEAGMQSREGPHFSRTHAVSGGSRQSYSVTQDHSLGSALFISHSLSCISSL